MEAGNSTYSTKSLAPFEECCGEFLGYRTCDDRILIRLRREYSIALPFSLELSRLLADFKSGDQIGILRTNDNGVRVRRLA
jgi:hypothetical protein